MFLCKSFLYLLHGYPGTGLDWLTNAQIQQKLDKLINEKKLFPSHYERQIY